MPRPGSCQTVLVQSLAAVARSRILSLSIGDEGFPGMV
jgi:hypothetical protein